MSQKKTKVKTIEQYGLEERSDKASIIANLRTFQRIYTRNYCQPKPPKHALSLHMNASYARITTYFLSFSVKAMYVCISGSSLTFFDI